MRASIRDETARVGRARACVELQRAAHARLPGGTIEERILPRRDHFALETDHFAECIVNDTEPRTPEEEGLKDLKAMMAIYEAARAGKTVALG